MKNHSRILSKNQSRIQDSNLCTWTPFTKKENKIRGMVLVW